MKKTSGFKVDVNKYINELRSKIASLKFQIWSSSCRKLIKIIKFKKEHRIEILLRTKNNNNNTGRQGFKEKQNG